MIIQYLKTKHSNDMIKICYANCNRIQINNKLFIFTSDNPSEKLFDDDKMAVLLNELSGNISTVKIRNKKIPIDDNLYERVFDELFSYNYIGYNTIRAFSSISNKKLFNTYIKCLKKDLLTQPNLNILRNVIMPIFESYQIACRFSLYELTQIFNLYLDVSKKVFKDCELLDFNYSKNKNEYNIILIPTGREEEDIEEIRRMRLEILHELNDLGKNLSIIDFVFNLIAIQSNSKPIIINVIDKTKFKLLTSTVSSSDMYSYLIDFTPIIRLLTFDKKSKILNIFTDFLAAISSQLSSNFHHVNIAKIINIIYLALRISLDTNLNDEDEYLLLSLSNKLANSCHLNTSDLLYLAFGCEIENFKYKYIIPDIDADYSHFILDHIDLSQYIIDNKTLVRFISSLPLRFENMEGSRVSLPYSDAANRSIAGIAYHFFDNILKDKDLSNAFRNCYVPEELKNFNFGYFIAMSSTNRITNQELEYFITKVFGANNEILKYYDDVSSICDICCSISVLLNKIASSKLRSLLILEYTYYAMGILISKLKYSTKNNDNEYIEFTDSSEWGILNILLKGLSETMKELLIIYFKSNNTFKKQIENVIPLPRFMNKFNSRYIGICKKELAFEEAATALYAETYYTTISNSLLSDEEKLHLMVDDSSKFDLKYRIYACNSTFNLESEKTIKVLDDINLKGKTKIPSVVMDHFVYNLLNGEGD